MKFIKLLSLFAVLLGGMLLSTGCSTPAYNDRERIALVSRNMYFEYQTMQDDIDMALLLRPAGHLTQWHVR